MIKRGIFGRAEIVVRNFEFALPHALDDLGEDIATKIIEKEFWQLHPTVIDHALEFVIVKTRKEFGEIKAGWISDVAPRDPRIVTLNEFTPMIFNVREIFTAGVARFDQFSKRVDGRLGETPIQQAG